MQDNKFTHKNRRGTMIILVVVLVLIIAIAVFVITGVLNLEKLQKDRNYQTSQQSDAQSTLSKSDEVGDIEADLDSTTFDDLNSELNQIEKDLPSL